MMDQPSATHSPRKDFPEPRTDPFYGDGAGPATRSTRPMATPPRQPGAALGLLDENRESSFERDVHPVSSSPVFDPKAELAALEIRESKRASLRSLQPGSPMHDSSIPTAFDDGGEGAHTPQMVPVTHPVTHPGSPPAADPDPANARADVGLTMYAQPDPAMERANAVEAASQDAQRREQHTNGTGMLSQTGTAETGGVAERPEDNAWPLGRSPQSGYGGSVSDDRDPAMERAANAGSRGGLAMYGAPASMARSAGIEVPSMHGYQACMGGRRTNIIEAVGSVPGSAPVSHQTQKWARLAQPRTRRPKQQPQKTADPVIAREQGFDNKAKKIGNRGTVWEEFPHFDIEGEAPAPPLGKTGRQKPQKKWNPKESRLSTLAMSTAGTRAKARKAHEDAQKIGPKRTPKRTTPHQWKPPKQWKAFDVSSYTAKRSSKIKTAAARDWQPKCWESLPDSVYKPSQDVDFV